MKQVSFQPITTDERRALKLLRCSPLNLLTCQENSFLFSYRHKIEACARRKLKIARMDCPNCSLDERVILNAIAYALTQDKKRLQITLQWILHSWALPFFTQETEELGQLIAGHNINLTPHSNHPPQRREQAGLYCAIG